MKAICGVSLRGFNNYHDLVDWELASSCAGKPRFKLGDVISQTGRGALSREQELVVSRVMMVEGPQNAAEFFALLKREKEINIHTSTLLPFQLALDTQGQLQLTADSKYPRSWERLETLKDEELKELAASGVAEHRFSSNNRPLLFIYRPGWEKKFEPEKWGYLDAFDPEAKTHIGLVSFVARMEKGIGDESHPTMLADGADLLPQTVQKLKAEGFPPLFLQAAEINRLRGIKATSHHVFGPKYINLFVDEGYRNKGAEGFTGVAQAFITTMMRICAEHFLLRGFVFRVAASVKDYYCNLYGARPDSIGYQLLIPFAPDGVEVKFPKMDF